MRLRTGSHVYYIGSDKRYKLLFGDIIGSKFDPFLSEFTYIIKWENGSISRCFEADLDCQNNYYDRCECGGVYLENEDHFDWCPIYEHFKTRRNGMWGKGEDE